MLGDASAIRRHGLGITVQYASVHKLGDRVRREAMRRLRERVAREPTDSEEI